MMAWCLVPLLDCGPATPCVTERERDVGSDGYHVELQQNGIKLTGSAAGKARAHTSSMLS